MDIKIPERPSRRNAPPTPAPMKIQNTNHEYESRFKGMVLYEHDDDEFDPEKVFHEFHHWERYSPDKSYSKRPYMAPHFKQGIRYFVDIIFIVNKDGYEERYVAAKMLKNEYDDLKKYCICFSCRRSFFNPLKYLRCNFCNGCVNAGYGYANTEYLNHAKKIKSIGSAPIYYNSLERNLELPVTQKFLQLAIEEKFFIVFIILFLFFYLIKYAIYCIF